MRVGFSLLGQPLRANIHHHDRTIDVLNMLLLTFPSHNNGSDNLLRAKRVFQCLWGCLAPSQQRPVAPWWTLSGCRAKCCTCRCWGVSFRDMGGIGVCLTISISMETLRPSHRQQRLCVITSRSGWGFKMRNKRFFSFEILVFFLCSYIISPLWAY